MSARAVPASFGQRLLWLMDRHLGAGGDLNERLAWRIRGPLDHAALQGALDALAARHEGLRTTFSGSLRSLTQEVAEPRPVPLTASRLAAPILGDAFAEIVAEAAEARIDPRERAWRARLWRLGPEDHVLLIGVHQLVTDPQSNAILAADLFALYARAAGGAPHPPELPPVDWQYADWSEWQRHHLDGDALAHLQSFWRDALRGARSVELPTAGAGPSPRTPGAKRYERRRLGADVADGLRRTARAERTTPLAVALAAFFVELHAASDQRDLTIGSLFPNRARPEVAHTVGFFVNLIALRCQVDADRPFHDVLRAVHATVTAAGAHQELPFQMLPPDAVARPTGGARSEEVVFQFVDGEPRATASARVEGLELEPIERQGRRSRFALELFVAHLADAVMPVLVYDASRFDAAWAAAFADGYARLLEAVAARPDAPVVELLGARA